MYGLLYRLTDADMGAMDGFEGHPIHYRRITVHVNGQGGEVDAYSYEVVNKKDDMSPSAHYLGLLQTAATRFAFPAEYQAFLGSFKTL